MKFFLDHDVPDDLEYSLRELGHQVVHLRDLLPTDATDHDALTHASSHGLVMVTCNRDDYLQLASQVAHSGIIIVIRRKTRVAERAALIHLLDRAGESGITANINFA